MSEHTLTELEIEPLDETSRPIVEAMANAIAITAEQHHAATPEDTPVDQPLPFPITVEHRERLITKIERQIEIIEARESRYMRARADAKEAATDLNDARTALQTFAKELRDVDAQLEAAKEPALPFSDNGDESRMELASEGEPHEETLADA